VAYEKQTVDQKLLVREVVMLLGGRKVQLIKTQNQFHACRHFIFYFLFSLALLTINTLVLIASAWGAERLEYDRGGNLIRYADRKGQEHNFNYDAVDRFVGATYADGSTVRFNYDAGNRLIQVIDSIGGTITNRYDVLDRLTTQTSDLGTIQYTHDALGRRTSMTVPGQALITYTYDAASRLTTITQGTQIVSFEYDAASRRTRVTLPNGVSTEYQYDAASRLTGMIFKNASGSLGNITYQYDSSGNRVAVGGTLARTAIPAPVATTSYDGANRQLRLAWIIHEGTQGSRRGPQRAVGAPFEGTDKTSAS